LTAFIDDAKFNAGNSIHLGGGLYFKGDFKNAEKINQEIKKLSSTIAKTILNFLKFNIVVTYNWAVSDVKDTGEYRILLSGYYNMCAFDLNKDNMDEVLSKIEELLKVVKKYKK